LPCGRVLVRATRIKGSTVEIGGDTTKLSKALEGVNKNIRTTQTQLKDVEKLLKLDPSNTELLSQKHKLLADAVTSTKEKLDTLKTADAQRKWHRHTSRVDVRHAAEQANTALANGDITQEQYDALQREIIETENELRNLQNEADRTNTAFAKLEAAGATMQKVGDKISGAGEKLLPMPSGNGIGTPHDWMFGVPVTAGVATLGTIAVRSTWKRRFPVLPKR